jgi:hypothetical protein
VIGIGSFTMDYELPRKLNSVAALRGISSKTRAFAVSLGSLSIALAGCRTRPPTRWQDAQRPPDPHADETRYRLRLRENPVDPGEAFRCYGACQTQSTPRGYVDCLSACPGFERTPKEYCTKEEVPPVAACFTVRKVLAKPPPDESLIVIGIVGSFLLVIGAQSLCTSSQSLCGIPSSRNSH